MRFERPWRPRCVGSALRLREYAQSGPLPIQVAAAQQRGGGQRGGPRVAPPRRASGCCRDRGLDAAEGHRDAHLVGESRPPPASAASMRARRSRLPVVRAGCASVAKSRRHVGDKAADDAGGSRGSRRWNWRRRAGVSGPPLWASTTASRSAIAGVMSAPRMSSLEREVVVERGLATPRPVSCSLQGAALETVLWRTPSSAPHRWMRLRVSTGGGVTIMRDR